MKLAILDLYDNTPNQGMRAIKQLVSKYEDQLESWDVFDVRAKREIPDLSYDIFISSGGPGNPLEGDGVWDALYYQWLDDVWNWNQQEGNKKKHVFFICHSFQMMVNHFKLGEITKRPFKSFGTFPTHKALGIRTEPVLEKLPEPFYVADFRDFQVINPNETRFRAMGARVIARENERYSDHIHRAIMGIRLSDEMVGTQFHPEADPEGMLVHFSTEEEKNDIIDKYGVEKYEEMVRHLNDEDKISLTYTTVIPTFLENALS